MDRVKAVDGLHAMMQFEVYNFADGQRSALEVYDAVAAEALSAGRWYYGKVTPAGVREAETFRQFYQRCIGAITAIAQRHPGQTLALVAHGGVLECAYRAALGLSLETPRNFPVLNASINRFSVEGGVLTLESWGEVEHLRRDVLDELG